MTIEETNMLNEKAKNRKDGVYSFRGYLWVVKDHRFIGFANPYGECFERFGSFCYRFMAVESYKRKETLKNWLKSMQRPHKLYH